MSYKYVVVWFNRAKHWTSGSYKNRNGNTVKLTHPLECNAKPFRSLSRAKKFQKEFFRPYPKIYEVKDVA